MIKGAQKQMIVLRTADSRYFDEAYFVLRKELPTPHTTTGEMVYEANRILRDCIHALPAPVKPKKRGWVLFAIGFLLGAVPFALLCFFRF